MTEKYSLLQRTGPEIFKCAVVLLGETVIQTEVAIKYPKMPGGVYRATAQPDVQWKLQQLQDANNYWAQALNTVIRITNLIGEARTTLCVPRKRTLLELCNLPVTRCFSPSLPPDLVFSYYISTNRLVCAAYQVTPKPNGYCDFTEHNFR
ncbi:unnamed protein product [Gongylonema pulchrum]|uniref:Cystatin domain-containing protein n=1 Tax=Gongylonema pulchrum TaxID=637853 RepID=A0A183E398_9BILA|nr:unnamed protein product [Gongylonema pulchrum]